MKKVFYLLALPLIFMYGCSKEDPISSDPSQEAVKFEIGTIDGQSLYARGTSITVEELPSKSWTQPSSKSSGDSNFAISQ